MGLAGAPDMLRTFSLEDSIPREHGEKVILNQGATSSCVAHAFVAGIHIAETRAGLPYVPCSRLFAYYNARREMKEQRFVLDNGTYLRTCAAALAHFGVPDEGHWPFSEFTLIVNKRPSFDAMRWAHPRAGGNYVKIYPPGDMRLDAIKSALHAGHPVAFGTLVTQSFLSNKGPARIKELDTSALAGGHAMLIIGWEVVEGETWFRVLNSWGPKWRDGGLCWFHQDLIAAASADDFHVIYGWNRIAQAKDHGP